MIVMRRLIVLYGPCGDVAKIVSDLSPRGSGARRAAHDRRVAMAKGQLRSNKEAKKPKKEKPKTTAAAPSVKDVGAKKK
jgi:hypothetical protein